MKPVQNDKKEPILQSFAKQMVAIAKAQQLIFSNPVFRDFRERLEDVRKNPLPKDHPLHNITGALKKNTIHETKNLGTLQFGAHFFPFGGPIVKGMNLVLLDRGGGLVELNFNINRVHKNHLMKIIRTYKSIPQGQLALFPFFLNANPNKLTLTTVRKPLATGENFSASTFHILDWQGASVTIAERKDNLYGNITGRITLKLHRTTPLQKVHELLAVFGLARALKSSTAIEVERMKIGQLFRAYYPRLATPFERTAQFFTLPLTQLKALIIKKAPNMKRRLTNELPLMYPVDTVPGRKRFAIPTLVQKVEKLGAVAVTHSTKPNLLPDALKTGLLSQEIRGEYLRAVENATADWQNGSLDVIFTKLTTKKEINEYGNFTLIISPRVLTTNPYQFLKDGYGDRSEEVINRYSTRPNLIEFTKRLAAPSNHEKRQKRSKKNMREYHLTRL